MFDGKQGPRRRGGAPTGRTAAPIRPPAPSVPAGGSAWGAGNTSMGRHSGRQPCRASSWGRNTAAQPSASNPAAHPTASDVASGSSCLPRALPCSPIAARAILDVPLHGGCSHTTTGHHSTVEPTTTISGYRLTGGNADRLAGTTPHWPDLRLPAWRAHVPTSDHAPGLQRSSFRSSLGWGESGENEGPLGSGWGGSAAQTGSRVKGPERRISAGQRNSPVGSRRSAV